MLQKLRRMSTGCARTTPKVPLKEEEGMSPLEIWETTRLGKDSESFHAECKCVPESRSSYIGKSSGGRAQVETQSS
jgi:hypothetical protein